MRKTIPTFKTDKEAEDFVATADLSRYDLSGGEVMRFEMKPKDGSPRGDLRFRKGEVRVCGGPV